VRGESGQASVELVAVLPLVALVALLLWQAVVAGEAASSVAGAARAAARAQAVGGDPLAAARRAVPGGLRRSLRVTARGDGVHVRLAVPVVVGGGSLGSFSASAAMPSQR
jgi:hypothetical protein